MRRSASASRPTSTAADSWPEPLVQSNPTFASGGTIDDLVAAGDLHAACSSIFRVAKADGDVGKPLRLHEHQRRAIEVAGRGGDYVLTTGTGSGKSLAYIIPIVDAVLRAPSPGKISAIVVYPMNALANSQEAPEVPSAGTAAGYAPRDVRALHRAGRRCKA